MCSCEFAIKILNSSFHSSTASCDHDEFTCDNNHCVYDGFKCDGDNDCRDNSDEKDCCKKRLLKICLVLLK